MAIDPQEIAEENTQRSALAEKGSPTEFAEDPKLSTQLAGGGYSGTGLMFLENKQLKRRQTANATRTRVKTR